MSESSFNGTKVLLYESSLQLHEVGKENGHVSLTKGETEAQGITAIVVGAGYSGFTDLDLYKVRPLEPIKNAWKEKEFSRKGLPSGMSLKPWPQGL